MVVLVSGQDYSNIRNKKHLPKTDFEWGSLVDSRISDFRLGSKSGLKLGVRITVKGGD